MKTMRIAAPSFVPAIKALRLDSSIGLHASQFDPGPLGATRVLVDSHQEGMYGGTGETSDWATLKPYLGDAILAGGLAPINVAEAISQAQPWGVDVSSGWSVTNERILN